MNVVVPSSSRTSNQFRDSSKKSSLTASSSSSSNFVLNLYDETPNFELSIDEFEVYALKRLKVLKTLERIRNFRSGAGSTGGNTTTTTTENNTKDIDSKIKKVVDEEKLSSHIINDTNGSIVDIDIASHYILRLSYCRTEELRSWFLRYECDLFRYRVKTLLASSSNDNNSATTASIIKKVVRQYADVTPISNEQKDKVRNNIVNIFLSVNEYNNQTIYAVPFIQVLNLVANRSCYIENGYVYVPESNIIDILVNKYRSNLSRELTIMAKHTQINAYMMENSNNSSSISTTAESVRIFPLIQNLDKVLVTQEPEYDENGMGILLGGALQLTANTVPSLVQHMPLCMRVLHNGLLKDKKLKYHGRLQYSLFLKGAGLNLDDAIQFFNKYFSSISTEEFNKQHAYSLRHTYGKEGKRENKRAYNCSKIIIGSPAPVGNEQHHGCPYKHYDDSHLLHLFQQFHIGGTTNWTTTKSDRNDILQLKQSHQYQLACQKHFEIQHPNITSMITNGTSTISLDNVGNHPNAWFRASLEYKHYNDNSGFTTTNNTADVTNRSFTNDSTPPPKQSNNSNNNNNNNNSSIDVFDSHDVDFDDDVIQMIKNETTNNEGNNDNNNNTNKRTSAEISP